MRWKVNRLTELRAFFRLNNPYLWAVILRLGLLILMRPHPRGDAADFQVIAHNLAEGHGFSRCWQAPFPPTSQRPPLFPFILSVLYAFEISDVYGPAILNLILDLFTMRVGARLAKALNFQRPQIFPWIIALCPMMITMGNYPLTESLGVLLFFLATLYLFENKTARSGFSFGLLALCRSYYILFPALMFVLRPLRNLPRKAFLVAVLMSVIAPAVWVGRNLVTLKRPLFSQTGTAGAQAYYGLCRRNVDWWDPEDVKHVLSTFPFKELVSAQCMTDDQVLSLNTEAWARVSDCVQERPGDTAVHVAIKTWSLFFEWGQIFPYDYVPTGPRIVINILLMLIWARMIWIWIVYFRKNPMSDAYRYAFMNIGYIFLVTLPFGIDARYLLAPELLIFGLTLSTLSSPVDFVREPILKVFGETQA